MSDQYTIIIDIPFFDRHTHSTCASWWEICTTKPSKRLKLITLEQVILKRQRKQSLTWKEQSHVLNWWYQLWSQGRIGQLQRRVVAKPASSLSGVEVLFAWTFLLLFPIFLDIAAPESFCWTAKCSNKIQNKLVEMLPENYTFRNAQSYECKIILIFWPTPPTPMNKLKSTDMSKHAGMHIHKLDNMKEKKENITVKSNYCRLDSKKCVRLNPNNHFGW